MRVSQFISAVLPFLAVCACSRTVPEAGIPSTDNNTVYISAFRPDSKSHIGSDGLSVEWDKTDKLCLWAKDSKGEMYLDGKEFRMFGMNGHDGIFTADLEEQMPEGTYIYYSCSPIPSSVSGTYGSFVISDLQDGSGSGVMVSTPFAGKELRTAKETSTGHDVRLEMNQLLHLLKLYISDPESALDGEAIERIELQFNQNVTGTLRQNIADPEDKAEFTGKGKIITLDLKNPIMASGAANRNYTYATISPIVWSKSGSMKATLFSATRYAQTKAIDINGREMKAGHATPVQLAPASSGDLHRMVIRLCSNPLGEELKTITLTAPEGCKWGDDGSNVYTISNGNGISVGSANTLFYLDASAFQTLSGKTVKISCESDNVISEIKYNIPDLTKVQTQNIEINVPWLLNEDFSKVGSFSSHDEYSSGFNSGDKDPYSFLVGWTGGRVGGDAGKCIRIACRRETSADYNARVDSAPLSAVLKKKCKLKVEFTYGSNNQFGGIAIVTDGNVGQSVYVGYVTDTKGFSSGSESGYYTEENSFYTKEYTGSYDNTPNEMYVTLPDVADNSVVRISWRSVVEHQAGTTNTTCWFYLDNVKVSVAE